MPTRTFGATGSSLAGLPRRRAGCRLAACDGSQLYHDREGTTGGASGHPRSADLGLIAGISSSWMMSTNLGRSLSMMSCSAWNWTSRRPDRSSEDLVRLLGGPVVGACGDEGDLPDLGVELRGLAQAVHASQGVALYDLAVHRVELPLQLVGRGGHGILCALAGGPRHPRVEPAPVRWRCGWRPRRSRTPCPLMHISRSKLLSQVLVGRVRLWVPTDLERLRLGSAANVEPHFCRRPVGRRARRSRVRPRRRSPASSRRGSVCPI